MTRREKQVALTDLCAEILTNIRQGLSRNARYRDVGPSRREQDKIMGDPVYYLETYFSAQQSSRTVETTQGAASEVAHGFQVSVWLEYEDGNTYQNSSQSTYENLIEGGAGLLPTLRGQPEPAKPGHPNVDDWPSGLELQQPDPPSEPIVNLDNQGRLAHLCRFEIELIHTTL